MGEIQNRLNSLKPYINGIRFVDGVQIVDAIFKPGWAVPDSSGPIKREIVDKEKNYHMFFSTDSNIIFDDLLDHVEKIIDVNIEREKKHALLKEKIQVLQNLFNTNSLNKLQDLTIGFKSQEDIMPTLDDMTFASNEPIHEDEGLTTPILNEKSNIVNRNGHKVELPPRDIPPHGEKVVLEDYDLPPEITTGECECGPNQACSKCLDTK